MENTENGNEAYREAKETLAQMFQERTGFGISPHLIKDYRDKLAGAIEAGNALFEGPETKAAALLIVDMFSEWLHKLHGRNDAHYDVVRDASLLAAIKENSVLAAGQEGGEGAGRAHDIIAKAGLELFMYRHRHAEDGGFSILMRFAEGHMERPGTAPLRA